MASVHKARAPRAVCLDELGAHAVRETLPKKRTVIMRARTLGIPIAATMIGITISAATLNNGPSEETKETTITPEAVWLTPGANQVRIAPTKHLPGPVEAGARRAQAFHYVSRVFHHPSADPRALGIVRRNIVLTAAGAVAGPGCKGGRWYSLSGAPGYVCSADGFFVGFQAHAENHRQEPPAVSKPLPYRYGKAASHDVLRYYRIPTKAEEREARRALAAGEALPEVVESRLKGVYLLALDREEQAGGETFLRTVRGRYVRAVDVTPKPLPAMQGSLLQGNLTLPLAFVWGDGPAALWRRTQDGGEALAGEVERHGRFPVGGEEKWGERAMVMGAGGLAVERSRVRVARRVARPDGVGRNEKWIHVDLDEQALVAYEGDRPVFATLVSSGKGAEFATPTGLYRMREKHITVTMDGPDPDEGFYQVEEVPWTMYYHDSFALHGAYWHNDFGKTRSHGCTNLAPTDARWLFYWSDKPLPKGFHALRLLSGTPVYLTRDKPAA